MKKDISKKYVLCRTSGGLNDSLNQIEICRRISLVQKRILVVQSNLGDHELRHRFSDSFEEIFSPINQNYFSTSEALETSIIDFSNDFDVFPDFYHPINQSFNQPILEFSQGIHTESRLKFWKYRKELVIVHEASGGGLGSASFLQYFQVSEKLLSLLVKASNQLNFKVVGIHFRAHDWGTELSKLYDFLSSQNDIDSFFISSDDNNIIDELRKNFPKRVFFSTSDLLTKELQDLSHTEIAILDLLLLATCNRLQIFEVRQAEPYAPRFSGFSRLAKHIWIVNKVKQHGFFSWATGHQPLFGVSGHKNLIPKVAFFLVSEIPRLVHQLICPNGVYKQLANLEKEKSHHK